MEFDPCIHAQRILEGKAEVECGFFHTAGAEADGKESALSVVEVLDEVRHTLPEFYWELR
jgi:hypothetical protein